MARRSINRLHIFVPNTIISADAHNAEHDLFTSAINDIYSNFELIGGKLYLPATQVRFENFSTLDLESFLRVAHNPDGSLRLDTIGGYPPSRTPAPNSVPVSFSNAKIDVNWLPLGHGGGLNADMLDGAHASVTPAPGAIPIARADGKLDPGWIPSTGGGGGGGGGGVSGGNADTVDGFHASATPQPNTLLALDNQRRFYAPHTPVIGYGPASTINTYNGGTFLIMSGSVSLPSWSPSGAFRLLLRAHVHAIALATGSQQWEFWVDDGTGMVSVAQFNMYVTNGQNVALIAFVHSAERSYSAGTTVPISFYLRQFYGNVNLSISQGSASGSVVAIPA